MSLSRHNPSRTLLCLPGVREHHLLKMNSCIKQKVIFLRHDGYQICIVNIPMSLSILYQTCQYYMVMCTMEEILFDCVKWKSDTIKALTDNCLKRSDIVYLFLRLLFLLCKVLFCASIHKCFVHYKSMYLFNIVLHRT